MYSEGTEYWVTRFVFQRSLGLIYLVAFAVAIHQYRFLCGERGLEPVGRVLRHLDFWSAPGLFWFNASDRVMVVAAWCGFVLSIIALTGLSEAFGIVCSMATWFCLWVLYMSFANAGGTFYSFGWESLLLETGFLAVFLGSNDTEPPVLVIWLLRWLLFRLMFGAGLIKIRGDECWRDLSCMQYHYETQPMPNPLSWYFHKLPVPVHKLAVLVNHIVELVVPFFYFIPRTAAFAGGATILFQGILIISGNFSWLNYLTICLCIPCFDDSVLRMFLTIGPPALLHHHPWHHLATIGLTAVVGLLSIRPVINLLSARQIMNTSFDPLHLVNTYGAFGSITKTRREIIIEGTSDTEISERTQWREYEFKGKPGNPKRLPPLVAPYHYRLDWQMWFAAMMPRIYDSWLLVLMQRLLEGDPGTLTLIARNPFPDAPPRHIRALLYVYHFTSVKERRETGAWWKRSLLGTYAPSMSLSSGKRVGDEDYGM